MFLKVLSLLKLKVIFNVALNYLNVNLKILIFLNLKLVSNSLKNFNYLQIIKCWKYTQNFHFS